MKHPRINARACFNDAAVLVGGSRVGCPRNQRAVEMEVPISASAADPGLEGVPQEKLRTDCRRNEIRRILTGNSSISRVQLLRGRAVKRQLRIQAEKSPAHQPVGHAELK